MTLNCFLKCFLACLKEKKPTTLLPSLDGYMTSYEELHTDCLLFFLYNCIHYPAPFATNRKKHHKMKTANCNLLRFTALFKSKYFEWPECNNVAAQIRQKQLNILLNLLLYETTLDFILLAYLFTLLSC